MFKWWFWLWGSIVSKLPPVICSRTFVSPINKEIEFDSSIAKEITLSSNISKEIIYNERDVCW
jgi:hypothetical protein